jgi:hypothetical protein
MPIMIYNFHIPGHMVNWVSPRGRYPPRCPGGKIRRSWENSKIKRSKKVKEDKH